jgi:hypothetical protein
MLQFDEIYNFFAHTTFLYKLMCSAVAVNVFSIVCLFNTNVCPPISPLLSVLECSRYIKALDVCKNHINIWSIQQAKATQFHSVVYPGIFGRESYARIFWGVGGVSTNSVEYRGQ